jgi:hypothetical protein
VTKITCTLVEGKDWEVSYTGELPWPAQHFNLLRKMKMTYIQAINMERMKKAQELNLEAQANQSRTLKAAESSAATSTTRKELVTNG